MSIDKAMFRIEGTAHEGFPSWSCEVSGVINDEQWLRDLAGYFAANIPFFGGDPFTAATIEIKTVETGTITPNP